jgi:hypothetical protein
MSHRFCVAAPGDYPSTPKITEFIVIGAAGGCLPVLVVPSPVQEGARRQLPYASTWLDYCQIAWIIPDAATKSEVLMRNALEALERVTPQEAEAKRRALIRVRGAFVAHSLGGDDGGGLRHSLSDFLLHEACELGRRYKDRGLGLLPPTTSTTSASASMPPRRRGWRGASTARDVAATATPLGRCLLAPEKVDTRK